MKLMSLSRTTVLKENKYIYREINMDFEINDSNLFVIPYSIEVKGDRLEVETFTQYFDGEKYYTLDDEPSLKIQKSIIENFDKELYEYLNDVYETANGLFPDMESVSTTVLYGTKNTFDTVEDEDSLCEIMQCLCYRVTSTYRFAECKYFIK